MTTETKENTLARLVPAEEPWLTEAGVRLRAGKLVAFPTGNGRCMIHIFFVPKFRSYSPINLPPSSIQLPPGNACLVGENSTCSVPAL